MDVQPENMRRRARTLVARRRHLLATAAVLTVGFLLSPAPALAIEYTGMLYGGTFTVGSGTSSATGGFIYGNPGEWTAPSGTNFAGFAYTSAAFSSVSDNTVGGVSAGFGGDGTANQPTILFPFTGDCSITNNGHEWTYDGALAGTNGQQTCNTSGDTGGWNYDNSEIDNTSPSTNPGREYHTLWLTVFCQAGTCNYNSEREWGAAGASVTNLSATIDDPSGQPSGSASWSGNNGSSWYQTDNNAPVINASASDPAGVCAIGAWLTGPGNYYWQLANSSPGMGNPGGSIGNEFDSITPCPGAGGGSVSGSTTLGANLASGTYSLSLLASNPGNWEAGNGLSNAPTIQNYASTINIDDTVPSISWANTSGAWTSSTTEQFTATAGPSGISHVSCTDNGTAVGATLVNGSTYAVPTSAQGANNMSCTASDGDVNGPLTSGASNQTYDVDTTTPTVAFSDPGYTSGAWTNSSQTVTVSATGGPSGISSLHCSVDQVVVPSGTATASEVSISENGEHEIVCVATSTTGVVGESTYEVWIDSRQPTVSYSGAQPAPTWLTGTPTVIVIGNEQGATDASGITKLTCSVNSGNPFVLNVDAALNYTSSFVLTPNGSDNISCQATDAAGTTGPLSNEAVNVDNPSIQPASSTLTKYGSSPEIDSGADPYTDGPSEKTWYHTPESVQITATNTAGGAAISQIDCTGAAQTGGGTYPVNEQNAYGNGGERITVTVQPPGGDLSCSAQDTAGNSYPLGSYEFQIDNQAPTGYFVPENQWPEPGEVQLHLTDGAQGSGVAAVEVTAQNNNGRIFKVMATRDPSTTGLWDAYFDDSIIPPGLYTFVAYPTDVAGNSTTIATNQAGTTETLPLPFREMTSITNTLASGPQRAAGSEQVAVSAAAANAAKRHSLTLGAASGLGAVGSESASAASATRARSVRVRYLTVTYGRKATMSGTLRNSRTHRPLVRATISIEQQIVGSKTITVIGRVRTNRKGAYSYNVAAGANRILMAVYKGSRRLRGAQADVGEHVKGRATISVEGTLTPGHSVDVTGRLEGGFVPARGALVTIQYAVKGFRGWTNWGDTRTNPSGDFDVHMPILPADAGYSFEWRAIIPAQTGWAYLAGLSNAVTRKII
jgi:hypothetical protein